MVAKTEAPERYAFLEEKSRPREVKAALALAEDTAAAVRSLTFTAVILLPKEVGTLQALAGAKNMVVVVIVER